MSAESFRSARFPSRLSEEQNRERKQRYAERAAHVISAVAEAAHGLRIPEETKAQWSRLILDIQAVDDRIDQIADLTTRKDLVAQLKSVLEGEPVEFEDPQVQKAMEDIMQLSREIGEERASFLHALLSLILNVTEDIRHESDPHKVVQLTLLEGQLTGKIFLPFLPPAFRKGPAYQKLVYTLGRFGRSANTIDTFTDLATDHKNGIVSIEPSLANRVLFLGSALTSGASTVEQTGLSWKLIREFVWGTKVLQESNARKAHQEPNTKESTS